MSGEGKEHWKKDRVGWVVDSWMFCKESEGSLKFLGVWCEETGGAGLRRRGNAVKTEAGQSGAWASSTHELCDLGGLFDSGNLCLLLCSVGSL